MKNRRLCVFISFVLCCISVLAYSEGSHNNSVNKKTSEKSKKPTLMILPSDHWCEQRFYMTTWDNQGMRIP